MHRLRPVRIMRRTFGTVLLAWTLATATGPSLLAADVEESVVKAKALYASAAFEEALTMLANVTSPDGYHYRALCLLALGRLADAERELSTLFTVAPTFVLRDEDVPPRFVDLFTEAKRKSLPEQARKLFAQARQDFDEKSYQRALDRFERVTALATDGTVSEVEGMNDLALLSRGFIDLARSSFASQASAAAASTAEATPVGRVASLPAGEPVESLVNKAGVTAPPVQTRQELSSPPAEGAEGAGNRPPAAAGGNASLSSGAAAAVADTAAIQGALEMYAGGYSRLDAAAVKQVYPGIDETRLLRGFGGYRSQQVQVRVERIQMTGPTTADVTTLQTTTASMQVGGTHRDTRRIVFRLEKRNGSWIILEHR